MVSNPISCISDCHRNLVCCCLDIPPQKSYENGNLVFSCKVTSLSNEIAPQSVSPNFKLFNEVIGDNVGTWDLAWSVYLLVFSSVFVFLCKRQMVGSNISRGRCIKWDQNLGHIAKHFGTKWNTIQIYALDIFQRQPNVSAMIKKEEVNIKL